MKIKYILGLFIFALAFNACEPMEGIYDEIDEEKLSYEVTNIELTLTDENYTKDMELSNTNFSSSDPAEDYIPAFLADTYPALGSGSRAMVTYNYYPGNSSYLYYIADGTAYTLITADYDAMGEEKYFPGKYDSFSTSVAPDAFLPAFLLTKYASAAEGDIVTITYVFHISSGNDVDRSNVYYLNEGVWMPTNQLHILTSEDYTSMGDDPAGHGNFSSSVSYKDYLPAFLKVKFPFAEANDIILVEYKYFDSSDYSTTNRYVEYKFDGMEWSNLSSTYEITVEYEQKNDIWRVAPQLLLINTTKAETKSYTLTDEDYDLVGNGKYGNFELRTTSAYYDSPETILAKINTIMKLQEMEVGDVFKITYKAYDGSDTKDYTIVLEVVEDVK